MLQLLLGQNLMNRMKCVFSAIRNYKFRKIYEELDHLEPKIHDEFTIWVDKIRNAKLVEINHGIWENDDGLIQVERHSFSNQKISAISPCPTSDFENRLDVFKLPLPIPNVDDEDVPEFLFVRPDDYELFIQFGMKNRRSVLLGNPGNSKSWFQWKFILFCYRPDIFNTLWNTNLIAGIIPETFNHHSKKARLNYNDAFFTPEIIVRTIAGKSSYVFFINGPDEVLEVSHNPKDLKKFTPRNSTLLWEPGEDCNPVLFSEIKSHIIATASLNEDQYHRFGKKATMLYMPCPSKNQIQVMNDILFRNAPMPNNLPFYHKVLDRMDKYGPEIRSLQWSQSNLDDFNSKKNEEISRICATESSLLLALTSTDQILENKSKAPEGCTHRVAKFSIKRDSKHPYYKSSMYLDFSSEYFLYKINQRIARFDIKTLKKHLIKFDNGNLQFEAVLPKYLERLYVAHGVSTDGLHWMALSLQHLPLYDLNKLHKKILNSQWQKYSIHFSRKEKESPTYKDMERKVLYYPKNEFDSFVNMYYKDDDDQLIGIKFAMGSKYGGFPSVHDFYEQLETTATKSPIRLYFIILPRMIEEVQFFQCQEEVKHSDSKFFNEMIRYVEDLQKGESEVDCHILLPPNNFGATFFKDDDETCSEDSE